MSDNYPPGVTGKELAIAGPDYEEESDDSCPQCGAEDGVLKIGHQGNWWLYCNTCQQETTIDPPDPGDDPDRKYDEERDRRMLGE